MRKHAFAVALFIVVAYTVQGSPILPSAAPAVRAASDAAPFPDLIPLPAGFGPEGIAVGRGSTFYAGSLTAPTLGQILVGNLRTGEFAQLVAPTGRPAVGLKYDARSHLLFVAGGPSGKAFIYNGQTGANVADVQLSTAASFINDVVITQRAVYFTNSTSLGRQDLSKNGSNGL